MTSINKLTQTPSLEDNDLSVVWQNSSGRTRAITIANLRKFIQSSDPNADAFVKAELVGDELILTSYDETETKIDINILPQHSVTELKDMPDNLVSGYYLKVNNAGTDFVLTPASEISAAIILEKNGEFQGAANVINFDDLDVEITNKIARVSTKPVSGSNGEIMKVEDGKLVPSGVMSNKDGSLSLSSGSVDIGPHTISSSGEGIEATSDSSGESYNFVFSGQGDDTGPVDRILGAESSIKTTEDLSLELTNHVSKLTAAADVRIIKQPVTIKPVSPQTNVTMQVTDLLGSDIWTYGPFDIDIDDSGDFKFTISTVLDFKIGEYLVTFLSPDGDVTLYGGISPISGEQIVYGELPFKPFHDETLHNIKAEGEIVREIEAGENVTTEIANGKLKLLLDYESLGIAYLDAVGTADLRDPDTDGTILGPLAGLQGDREGQAQYLRTVYCNTGPTSHKNYFNFNYYSTNDLYEFLPFYAAGILSFTKDGSSTKPIVFKYVRENGDTYKSSIDILGSFTDWELQAGAKSGLIEKHSKAELNYIQIAYQGKYGDDRNYYPIDFQQDNNGWTQFKFTGYAQFKPKDKSTGEVGDTVLEIRSSRVQAKKPVYYNDDRLATLTEVDDKIDNLVDPQPGTSANSIRAAKVTGYANNYTSITYVDDKIQGFKFGKDNCLCEIVHYSNSKLSYLMIHKDNVSSIIGRDVDDGDLVLGVNVTSDARVCLGKYTDPLPTPIDSGVVAKIAYNYYAITQQIEGANQDANAPTLYLKSDGSTTTVDSEAKRMGYSPYTVKLNKEFEGRDWGYSLMRGFIKSDKTFEANSDSPYYVMAVEIGGSLSLTKQHTVSLHKGSIVIYNNPLDASLDENPIARVEDVNENPDIVYQQQFKAKSGYDRVSSGGGSTHKIEYWENGSIFKLSNSKIEVHLLEGMNADSNKHGYVKYINSRNDDVTFEWYDRNGNRINSSTVPSSCPADTVVDIFANYDTDDYFLTFSQSKAISGDGLEEVIDYAIEDKLSVLGFDLGKVCTVDKPDSAKYDFIDSPNRLGNSAEINIILDSAKPRGALQLENKANYHGDRPEMVVYLYIDSEVYYLGGLRLPYGTGCYLRYNLDNKTQQHMAKGYWTYSVHYNDYSLIASSKEAENDALMEGLASGAIYAKTVTIG